ncbi:MAG: matrixin family metalloprotease [Planctomycetota bacterium]
MTRWWGRSEGASSWPALVVLVLCVLPAQAFTLLGFPPDSAVIGGQYRAWALDDEVAHVLDLTFAVEGGFDAALAPGAALAALNAAATWDAASSVVSFVEVGYDPVENSETNFMTMWFNRGQWEGPAVAFGLGANIDIMARPQDFTLVDYRGKCHGFKDSGQGGAGSLAFSVVNATNGRIHSVDIYLNRDYAWSTGGAPFDVETIVLHELGHALGLDHPDQAVAMGAVNYDPVTLEPGAPVSGTAVMHSTYWPDGLCRRLTRDERGGLAFLYHGRTTYHPPPTVLIGLPGDADGDFIVTLDDFRITKRNLGLIDAVWADGDGDVDLDDFCTLKKHFGTRWDPAIHCPDLDGDGDVDDTDVEIARTLYGTYVTLPSWP